MHAKLLLPHIFSGDELKLQKTILSTADVARLFNVTETTVKRWSNDGTLKCMKTPGGHRKFEMKNVVEFAQLLNFEPCGALRLTNEDALAQRIQVAILSRDFRALKEAFIEKALSRDKQDMFIYFSYLYQHRIHLWEIYDLIIWPGMAVIGERWAAGELTIEEEHRASYETMDALAKLQTQICMKPENGLSVVCACPGEELHEIGLRCVSYLFESEGWISHYLGARVPYTAIVGAVREMQPEVLCLSRTLLLEEECDIEQFTELITSLSESGTQVIIGGRALQEAANLFGKFASTYSSSLELLTFMKELQDEIQRSCKQE